jgi:sugar phosphate isomerase/epimerase
VRETIALAPRLGVERVILMSGCPGGPGDRWANWITVAWPPEAQEVLRWQWEEAVIPYWRDLVAHAEEHGVRRLCVELHGQQVVYNVPTLLRLREAVGPVVGANFDPSHLMWMGASPIAAIEALGDAIYHVHAKDTRLEPPVALTSRLETLPPARARERAWNYATLGHGHDAEFWRDFCVALRRAGYDDVLSIEHEDHVMDPVEAVAESVGLLRAVLTDEQISLRV